ncbi:hypothetical protein HRG_014705 [Hirsutella rhossiliensis]
MRLMWERLPPFGRRAGRLRRTEAAVKRGRQGHTRLVRGREDAAEAAQKAALRGTEDTRPTDDAEVGLRGNEPQSRRGDHSADMGACTGLVKGRDCPAQPWPLLLPTGRKRRRLKGHGPAKDSSRQGAKKSKKKTVKVVEHGENEARVGEGGRPGLGGVDCMVKAGRARTEASRRMMQVWSGDPNVEIHGAEAERKKKKMMVHPGRQQSVYSIRMKQKMSTGIVRGRHVLPAGGPLPLSHYLIPAGTGLRCVLVRYALYILTVRNPGNTAGETNGPPPRPSIHHLHRETRRFLKIFHAKLEPTHVDMDRQTCSLHPPLPYLAAASTSLSGTQILTDGHGDHTHTPPVSPRQEMGPSIVLNPVLHHPWPRSPHSDKRVPRALQPRADERDHGTTTTRISGARLIRLALGQPHRNNLTNSRLLQPPPACFVSRHRCNRKAHLRLCMMPLSTHEALRTLLTLPRPALDDMCCRCLGVSAAAAATIHPSAMVWAWAHMRIRHASVDLSCTYTHCRAQTSQWVAIDAGWLCRSRDTVRRLLQMTARWSPPSSKPSSSPQRDCSSKTPATRSEWTLDYLSTLLAVPEPASLMPATSECRHRQSCKPPGSTSRSNSEFSGHSHWEDLSGGPNSVSVPRMYPGSAEAAVREPQLASNIDWTVARLDDACPLFRLPSSLPALRVDGDLMLSSFFWFLFSPHPAGSCTFFSSPGRLEVGLLLTFAPKSRQPQLVLENRELLLGGRTATQQHEANLAQAAGFGSFVALGSS